MRELYESQRWGPPIFHACDGAVCGGWWKGPNNDYVQEGFGILDLNPDGTFAHQYFDYGWEAKG
ncbi:hypothetical protein HY256_11330 [Candidatus Sumerlaeota bacterium]|nr:hypothetical protein [Candidatus Sumerlaeota bacterium]